MPKQKQSYAISCLSPIRSQEKAILPVVRQGELLQDFRCILCGVLHCRHPGCLLTAVVFLNAVIHSLQRPLIAFTWWILVLAERKLAQENTLTDTQGFCLLGVYTIRCEKSKSLGSFEEDAASHDCKSSSQQRCEIGVMLLWTKKFQGRSLLTTASWNSPRLVRISALSGPSTSY